MRSVEGFRGRSRRRLAAAHWLSLLGVGAAALAGWIPQFWWHCALPLVAASLVQWLIESRSHTALPVINAVAIVADLERMCDGVLPVRGRQIQAFWHGMNGVLCVLTQQFDAMSRRLKQSMEMSSVSGGGLMSIRVESQKCPSVQAQDRISQIFEHAERDVHHLSKRLQAPDPSAPLDVGSWLASVKTTYKTPEEVAAHEVSPSRAGEGWWPCCSMCPGPSGDSSTTPIQRVSTNNRGALWRQWPEPSESSLSSFINSYLN